MSTDEEPAAAMHPPLTAVAQADAHLRRAELEVSWLRWLGMASWALILLRNEFKTDASIAWAIYGAGIIYTGLAHWRIVSSR